MPKPMPLGDLDLVLGRAKRDLQDLPRHEWDAYLLSLCSRFVCLDDGTAKDGWRGGRLSPDGNTSSPGTD